MQEWYLLDQKTRPNVTGGYENDAFLEIKDDAFAEALETDIATSVILYNSDLGISKQIRCIIQGNTANTQLKSLERTVLFEIGTVKAGMYIFFENRYWLIDGYPGNNGIYEKATMVLCQYLLRWQNSDGKIIERWCNGVSASKYDVGENGNFTVNLSSNTYTIKLPGDEECLKLDMKRVFIDKKQKNPEKVFKLTRNDDILFDYGDEYHGSILSFIADKKELNLQTDNQELRICDYIDQDTIPSSHNYHIIGGDSIKVGIQKKYSYNFEGDKNSADLKWNINSNYNIPFVLDGKDIYIEINDISLIGLSFVLELINHKEVLDKLKISIIDAF